MQALKHRPLSEVWLLVPRLSRWQWHPFSVASGGGPNLKLHIKTYGRFTKVGGGGQAGGLFWYGCAGSLFLLKTCQGLACHS